MGTAMEKQKVENIEVHLKSVSPSCDHHAIATKVVSEIMSGTKASPGADHYKARAVNWVSMILSAENKGVDSLILFARLRSLCLVSEGVKADVGGVYGRLGLFLIKSGTLKDMNDLAGGRS